MTTVSSKTATPGPAFSSRERGTGDQGGAHPNPSSTAMHVPPLHIGNLTIDVPVVLAPMAGITNKAVRRLCREYGGGLYVSEMVTARDLVESHPDSTRIIEHDEDETPRSVQLYSVDPDYTRKAVRMIVRSEERRV